MQTNPFVRLTDDINVRLFDIGGHAVTLGTLIAALLTMVVAYAFSYVVRRGVIRAAGATDEGSMHAVTRLLHYAIVLAGFSVALETVGIDLRALFAAGALFAVGIGFAMQNIMQNFVSGIILLVEHSIRPGDVLEIEGKQVRVVEMGVRSTLVRSRDDEVLIVPNSTLVQGTVRSYTLLDTLCRVRVAVGVGYDMDMEVVRATLQQAADGATFRSSAKEPLVLLNDFGDSAAEWEVSIWIDDPWQLRPSASALREAVWQACLARKIRLAFPQLDVHLDEPALAALGRRAA